MNWPEQVSDLKYKKKIVHINVYNHGEQLMWTRKPIKLFDF